MNSQKNKLMFSRKWLKIIPVSSLLLLGSCSNDEESIQNITSLSEVEISSASVEIAVANIIAETEQEENPATNAIDDDSTSRWSGFGTDVDLTLDLGITNLVDYVNISFYQGDERTASFEVYGSSDDSEYVLINSKTSIGTSDSLETYDLNNTEARYIRFKFFGNSNNDWNSITDIEVYGTPGEDDTDSTDCVQQEIVSGGGDCDTDLGIEQEVSIELSGNDRIITTNNIPLHQIGTFMNADVTAQSNTYTLTSIPEDTGSLVSLQGETGPDYIFGVLLNGVELDPIAAEPWPHSDLGIMDPDANWDWNLEALTAPIGLDCNYAHVQPTGKYHYHGSPALYSLIVEADGTEMIQVGWAADGFPIYYKYAYSDASDSSSNVIEMTSSYKLLTGNRPGDGVSAPCSEYNGAYSADYEYIEGLGTLDETNGRTGVTPEFPEGTFYYVLTDGDSFPSIPRYFRGTPSDDFFQGPEADGGPGEGGPGEDGPGEGGPGGV